MLIILKKKNDFKILLGYLSLKHYKIKNLGIILEQNIKDLILKKGLKKKEYLFSEIPLMLIIILDNRLKKAMKIFFIKN